MPNSILHIDPKILASIQDFDWFIRSLAMGEYHGRKRSGKLGVGMEFSQYRPYSQGDDLRQLDWKMYARTDKFYIKQSEVETNVEVTFIIDSSRSMLYEEKAWSKLNFAKLLTGVLGFVAMENGDWIGLADNVTVKSGNDSRYWKRFLNRLQLMEANQTFEAPFVENRRVKELFVVISDLYDDQQTIIPFINSLKSPRNEVIVFHVMGRIEEDLEFGSAIKLRDLETDETVQLNSDAHRSSYLRQIAEWKNQLENQFLLKGIDYHHVDFTMPIEDSVNSFLNRRKRLL
ncbi:MAG: DUF58 domain-containing protein [Cyclobacteriaceae bacterium]